jgi:hypothetical protein
MFILLICEVPAICASCAHLYIATRSCRPGCTSDHLLGALWSIASRNKPPHPFVGKRQRDNHALMAATIYLNVPIMIAAYWGGIALERRHLLQSKIQMYQCAEMRGDGCAVCGKL